MIKNRRRYGKRYRGFILVAWYSPTLNKFESWVERPNDPTWDLMGTTPNFDTKEEAWQAGQEYVDGFIPAMEALLAKDGGTEDYLRDPKPGAWKGYNRAFRGNHSES